MYDWVICPECGNVISKYQTTNGFFISCIYCGYTQNPIKTTTTTVGTAPTESVTND